MGDRFDLVHVECDLPDGFRAGGPFTTRDLGCGMLEYRIGRSGRLDRMVTRASGRDGCPRHEFSGWEPVAYEGLLVLELPTTLRCYNVTLHGGTVKEIGRTTAG